VLAYSERGSGPTVVLAHGLASDRSRWDPVVDLLADELRCVSVDLPGHGESSPEGSDVVSAVMAVHELVKGLGLEPAAVVGHSLGANIALVYGALFGPRSVVAVDPTPLHLPHFSDSLAPYAQRLQGDDFEAAFHAWEGRFALDQLPEPLGRALAAGIQPRKDVVLSYWADLLDHDMAEAAQQRLAAALASITCPTLLCLAEPPSPEDAAIIAPMATTTVEVFHGLGHFLHLVDPERFATRLRTWVASLP
jgi:pimeloyl-ACP methyl ester carboxylesterase